MRDITSDITERMAALQETIEALNKKRAVLEDQVRIADQRLQALRVLFDWEGTSHGKRDVAKVSVDGQTSWLGMPLREAVRRLKGQFPDWPFEKIRDRLIQDGFDFKGKKPGSAVNMALISLRRKQNSGGEAEG
jgi:hypothetical protein